MKYRVGMISDPGNRRKDNQDNALFRCGKIQGEPSFIAAVADGMGGLAFGERASSIMINRLLQWWKMLCIRNEIVDRDELSQELDQVYYDAHREIFYLEEQEGRKIGTTGTLLFMMGSRGLIKHVGDSRIYFLSEGRPRQLTTDHTYYNALRQTDGLVTKPNMEFENQALINAIGASAELEIETHWGEIKQSAGFLLASDGFYNGIPGLVDHYEWMKQTDPQYTLEEQKEVILSGPARDNLTAILIWVDF